MTSTTTTSSSSQRDLTRTILTEHFGYAPETFAKQGMDLANVSMYSACKAVEDQLMERVGTGEGHNNGGEWDEEEVQKGMMRLETLLESQIDKHFELFDLYILRNTFAIHPELIPFLQLSHQKGIEESLRGKDEIALKEYQEELRAYEEEMTRGRELALVRGVMERKLEESLIRAEEIGWLKGAESLETRTLSLSTSTSHLTKQLHHLLSTPRPIPHSFTQGTTTTGGTGMQNPDPWDGNRAAYVNWAAQGKAERELSRVGNKEGQVGGGGGLGEVKREMGETGMARDAKTLADVLSAPPPTAL